MTIQSVVTGRLGERLAFQRLRNMGRVKAQTLQHAGDLSLNGIRIEVKTSRLTKVNQKYFGWQFCLRRAGHTDIGHSDFVVLLCLNNDNEPVHALVIPVDVLRESRRKISIVQGKSTKWHCWKGRFDLIESALSKNDLSGFDFDSIEPIEF
jgi:hypothetical protein